MLWDQIEERIKGFEYAAQPGRITILGNGDIMFDGKHRPHLITWTRRGWCCDCDTYWRFLPLGGWCRHIIAVERILTAVDEGTALVCRAETVQ